MTEPVPCSWAPADDALYRAYHDQEWGVPERGSLALWAKLQLDGMQAGLSWITILRKRQTIRDAFDGFDPERIARWDEAQIAKAMQNPGIIRSRAKITACVSNARIFLNEAECGEDFSKLCWAYVGNSPIVSHHSDYRNAPTHTAISAALAGDLKRRGYKFVGPTIVYAWMQACGLYNDHETGCPRHAEIQETCR